LYVPLSKQYSLVGDIVIEKLGPGMLLLDSSSFHAPLQAGEDLEHPKETTKIAAANVQPKQLFFVNSVFRISHLIMLDLTCEIIADDGCLVGRPP
jgi:hypothetical protein